MAQAKNYAGKLAIRFTYATNGQGIYGIDMKEGRKAKWPRYPDAGRTLEPDLCRGERLARPLRRRAFRGQGRLLPAPLLPGHRHRAGAGSDCRGKTRILLTLATGTGKTFIAFQIAWKLFHSRWNLSREADAPPADLVPGRPQHPRRPGV